MPWVGSFSPLLAFCDFRAHGPRMRLDDLPTPSRRFVARVSASVATVDRSPGRGWVSRAADNDFASVLTVPTAVSEGSVEAPATTTSVAQPTPSRSSVQGTDSVEPADLTASVSTLPGSPAPRTMTQSSDRISSRTCRRSVTIAGQAPPAVDHSFEPGGAPRPSSRRLTTRPRVPRPRPAPPAAATPGLAESPVRTVPLPSDRDHTEPTGIMLLGLTPSPGDTPTAPTGRMPTATLLNCGSLIPSHVIRMPIGSESSTLSQRATPRCVTSLSAGRRPCRLTFWRATPPTSVPPYQTSRSWRVRVDYIQPTTTSSYSSVTRHRRRQDMINPILWGELLACYTTSRFASTSPCLCALGSCKHVIRRPLVTLAPRARCTCWSGFLGGLA